MTPTSLHILTPIHWGHSWANGCTWAWWYVYFSIQNWESKL